jgi:hypothetical protein
MRLGEPAGEEPDVVSGLRPGADHGPPGLEIKQQQRARLIAVAELYATQPLTMLGPQPGVAHYIPLAEKASELPLSKIRAVSHAQQRRSRLRT